MELTKEDRCRKALNKATRIVLIEIARNEWNGMTVDERHQLLMEIYYESEPRRRQAEESFEQKMDTEQWDIAASILFGPRITFEKVL